jgi:hypothetical protein
MSAQIRTNDYSVFRHVCNEVAIRDVVFQRGAQYNPGVAVGSNGRHDVKLTIPLDSSYEPQPWPATWDADFPKAVEVQPLSANLDIA